MLHKICIFFSCEEIKTFIIKTFIIIYCIQSAKRLESQLAPSTCYDSVTLRGISRQQSVRTVSWPAY